MELELIAAVSKNRVIGKDNKLLWHIPKDLKNFRNLTMNNTVIMGRLTYESLPKDKLPKRYKIVITKDPASYNKIQCSNTVFVNSKKMALEAASHLNKKTFIIGGSKIYKMFIEDCNKAYITYIDRDFEGDTYFPEFSLCPWKKTESKEFENFDINNHNNNFEYRMEIWQRITD